MGPLPYLKVYYILLKTLKCLHSDFSFNFSDLSKTNYVKHIQNYAPIYYAIKLVHVKVETNYISRKRHILGKLWYDFCLNTIEQFYLLLNNM